MKNIILNICILSSIFITLSSCSNGIPEDVHDHDEVEKFSISVIDANDNSNIQTVNIISGIADGELILENGKTYNISLSFFGHEDDHIHNATEEIIEERDEHFITYDFAGLENITVKRTDEDPVRTDGNKLGLKTQCIVNSTPNNSAKLIVNLHHLPTKVSDTDENGNQKGTASGGSIDLVGIVSIK